MEAAPADEEVLISGWFIHQPRFAFVCAHKTWFNQLWWLSFLCCGHRNCLTNGSWRFSFTKKMSVTTSTATASVCIFLKKKKKCEWKNPGPTRDPSTNEQSHRTRDSRGRPQKIQKIQNTEYNTNSRNMLARSPNLSKVAQTCRLTFFLRSVAAH